MKNKIFLISILVLGCNKPIDKPITEPLSASELNSLYKQEDNFKKVYKYIEKTKLKYLSTESDKAEFIDLTYHNFMDFVDFARDIKYSNKIYSKAEDEWYNKYGVISKRIDSIVENSNENVSEKSIIKYLEYEKENKEDDVLRLIVENPFRKDISKNILGIEYVDMNSYISNKKDSIYNSKYPICYRFKQLNTFDFEILLMDIMN